MSALARVTHETTVYPVDRIRALLEYPGVSDELEESVSARSDLTHCRRTSRTSCLGNSPRMCTTPSRSYAARMSSIAASAGSDLSHERWWFGI